MTRVEGGETSEAVYLRLERKEGSVYAYESDDGVNFALIVTVSLTLGFHYDSGLIAFGSNTTSANYSMVNVQPSNIAPEANINLSAYAGIAPLKIQAESLGSHGPNVVFKWDFGDGNTVEGESLQYTFLEPGSFEVRLTVEENGQSVTAKESVTVLSPQPPNAEDGGLKNITIYEWYVIKSLEEKGITELLKFIDASTVNRVEAVSKAKNKVVYRKTNPDYKRDTSLPRSSNIFEVVDLNTGESKVVTPSIAIDFQFTTYAGLSPDGSLLVFENKRDVYLLDTKTFETWKVVDLDEEKLYFPSNLTFSPDNSQLAFVALHEGCAHGCFENKIGDFYLINVGVERKNVPMDDPSIVVTSVDSEMGFGNDLDFKWDGDRLIWTPTKNEGISNLSAIHSNVQQPVDKPVDKYEDIRKDIPNLIYLKRAEVN